MHDVCVKKLVTEACVCKDKFRKNNRGNLKDIFVAGHSLSKDPKWWKRKTKRKEKNMENEKEKNMENEKKEEKENEKTIGFDVVICFTSRDII